jgi:Fe-S oxidoreductase/nitrate reductase gamma subunit
MEVYVLAAFSLAIAMYGILRHYRKWRTGKNERRFDQIFKRFRHSLGFIFGQRRILREAYPGIMHLLIFWGFAVLFLGTLTIAFQEDFLGPLFDKELLYGDFYLIYSLTLDIFGLLAILGVLLALYRRYVTKPNKLDNKVSDLILLCLILFILITGFCVEGLRISASHPPWALWSPVGWSFAELFDAFSPVKSLLKDLHRIFWWTHLLTSAGLFAYLPFSNLFHVISSSLNVFFRSLEPRGSLDLIDFQVGRSFGVGQINDFTWKHLLDLDACTRCGRCQENCPAYLSEKPLNPKKVVLDLKAALYEFSEESYDTPLSGGSISEDELWACTTCHACVEVCPVFIEHVKKIVDLRRHLVMEKAQFPKEVKLVFRNLETYADTYGKGASSRMDWADRLPVKRVCVDSEAEVLFWVGCEGSFNDRNKEVARALVGTLEKAGIAVDVLGKDERCCGDPARRIGNEYLFENLACRNIEVLNRYGVQKIITYCPHCLNALKNEYPQFGGQFEVIHYTQYLSELLKQGKLRIERPMEEKITFHDPCYLGRVNEIYGAPREIIRSIPGLVLREMNRSGEKGFCCGGGGGRMWMHEGIGQRINQVRSIEAAGTGIDLIGTACPYCLSMFEDGIRNLEKENEIDVLDLAEIVYRCV